jgi:TctA family transporter
VRGSTFDIVMVAAIGIICYVPMQAAFIPALLRLGLVLGPLIKTNLRRVLLVSRGDPIILLEHPIACGFVIATTAF